MTAISDILQTVPPAELARRLNVSLQLVCNWRKAGQVPASRVLAIEAATGVPRHVIRPDYYPPEDAT
jgi:DNA-binding transcriptional regulator YdaS (Cro superfamily)